MRGVKPREMNNSMTKCSDPIAYVSEVFTILGWMPNKDDISMLTFAYCFDKLLNAPKD